MTRFLVTLDPIANCDAAFLQGLAFETGRSALQWERELVAPTLARVLLTVQTEVEAADWTARLKAAGLSCHVVAEADAVAGMRAAFEASRAELRGEELVLAAEGGAALTVLRSEVEHVTVGLSEQGAEGRFLVLAVTRTPGAVVLRWPGTDTSSWAPTPDAALQQLTDGAPHIVVERALQDGAVVFPVLQELGTADVAHAATLSAWLKRTRVTTAPAAETSAWRAPVTQASGKDEPARGPAWLRALRRRRVELGIAAALLLVVGLFVGVPLPAPPTASAQLQLGETWRSPYGVAFTFRRAADDAPGVVGVPRYTVEVRRGSDRRELDLRGNVGTEQEALGVAFWIKADPQRLRPSFVVIEARSATGVSYPRAPAVP